MPKPCPDCGPAPVIHWVEKISVIVDWMLSPIAKFSAWTSRPFRPFSRALTKRGFWVSCLNFLAAIRLMSVTEKLDKKDNLRTQALWESADKLGIRIKEFRLFGTPGNPFFVAEYRGKEIAFEGLPRIPGFSDDAIEWMDDKKVMKKKFAAEGIPVAQGDGCFTLKHALDVFREIEGAVVVKPSIGSRSRHTFTGINSEEKLAKAFRSAKRLSPWVVVEEELAGLVYRGTVVGGKLGGVVSREPASVTGDGIKTVRELVAIENENPLRHGPIYHEIHVDDGQLEDVVPEKGERVIINRKVSRSVGAIVRDVTDKTHLETVELLERIGCVLDASVVGIDFIVGDIGESWKEQKKCGVIECNSLPFIDLHHYPLAGTSRDVGGMIWKRSDIMNA
jgi:D-alanine-D-alanine ligase-like ATP-grasp enzyme